MRYLLSCKGSTPLTTNSTYLTSPRSSRVCGKHKARICALVLRRGCRNSSATVWAVILGTSKPMRLRMRLGMVKTQSEYLSGVTVTGSMVVRGLDN